MSEFQNFRKYQELRFYQSFDKDHHSVEKELVTIRQLTPQIARHLSQIIVSNHHRKAFRLTSTIVYLRKRNNLTFQWKLKGFALIPSVVEIITALIILLPRKKRKWNVKNFMKMKIRRICENCMIGVKYIPSNISNM